MTKSIPSIIKNVAQPKRSQAYYDAIAKQLERGMLAYNPKTGNTTYSTKYRSTVLKGLWDDTRLFFAKHNVRSKFNPNPSVLECVGKNNIIKDVSNNILPKSNSITPFNILA